MLKKRVTAAASGPKPTVGITIDIDPTIEKQRATSSAQLNAVSPQSEPKLVPAKSLEKDILTTAKEMAADEIVDDEEEQEEEDGEEDDEEAEEEEHHESSRISFAPPIPKDIGRIDLSFPETTAEFSESSECYPPSYYTLSAKERLLLLFAENFRRQFQYNYMERRPLVMAVKNEANVQKFVCSTIRPTAFSLPPLIGSVQGCASFVADFIIYEPLEDLVSLPTRLVSPSTLLRRRCGNSFEMATLLCSMLIGARYPAMVVSGVARLETVLNDQRNVEYPYSIEEAFDESVEKARVTEIHQKYKLKPMPDLTSHLEEQLEAFRRAKEEEEQRAIDEIERKLREARELKIRDKYHFSRTHAWVVIIDNAPWSVKPRKKCTNDDGEEIDAPTTARFIEPTTGFECDTSSKQYILVESVWNHHNYYVNLQKYERISDMNWDLRNTDDWEHFLPGEPPEMRQQQDKSDENLAASEPPVADEKHLDTIRSWVQRLHIGLKEFEERFPKREKVINYRRTIHERFSPYSQRDGKYAQLTQFADDEYEVPETRWDWYVNRSDMLQRVKYVFSTGQVEETFMKGRPDCLKLFEHSTDWSRPKRLHFFAAPRPDALKLLEVYSDRIVLHFSGRSDFCYYQEFIMKAKGSHLKEVTEKFHRNTRDNIPPNKDIAIRIFYLSQNKIFLKFQYARGVLTASTLEFIKPPKPGYGQEIIFDPSLTKAYKANVSDPDPTQLELYKLLLEQLKYEEKIKKNFEKLLEEINAMLEQRKDEMSVTVLKFSIFDPLRNEGARKMRLRKHDEEEQFKRDMATKTPDFLAPYLVPYANRDGRPLTYEESWSAYNACLNDMKSRFVGLLNELQRQYEDLTTEAQSLKRFLTRFEDQFDNFDYERLMQEAKELNKRMVQQRLAFTHEQAQKKYETVKESMLEDKRLNLQKNSNVANGTQ